MKIFYGVQGTGNGHTTRARVMAKALYAAGMTDVDFLFSGRPADKYFDMEIFNDYQVRKGLTFSIDKGQVNIVKTAYEANPFKLNHEISELDLSPYDLVITDFEPITAWAAKKQKKNTLGIGHQYAFKYKIPRKNTDIIAEQVMKYFAPADNSIGFHWHHFDQPILPPIIETDKFSQKVIKKNKIIVYLPFEDQHDVIDLLVPFTDFVFHVYSPEPVVSRYEHILCYPLSREGFLQNHYDCEGIISNSGFELASESLHLGKKILAKPIHGQMEQLANGAALEKLGYGLVMNNLDRDIIERWLYDAHAVHVTYPNTAEIIVQWIKDGMPEMDKDFFSSVWQDVKVERLQTRQ
jgi:uncharacterized protein (TIGR00661 family)